MTQNKATVGIACYNNCGRIAKMVDDRGKYFCSIECAAEYNLKRLERKRNR
jgi:hypothetical protein